MKNFFSGTDKKNKKVIKFVRTDKKCGFTIGNAQKIVNMTFKYLFCVMNDNNFKYENFKDYFKYCHYTLDEITIEKVTDKGKNYTWSSMIVEYDEIKGTRDTYMVFQRKIRKICKEEGKILFFKKFDDWSEQKNN